MIVAAPLFRGVMFDRAPDGATLFELRQITVWGQFRERSLRSSVGNGGRNERADRHAVKVFLAHNPVVHQEELFSNTKPGIYVKFYYMFCDSHLLAKNLDIILFLNL